MTRALPFALAAIGCYILALVFGVHATVAVAVGAYWPALLGWIQWLCSTVLMYVFGALVWVETQKNRAKSVMQARSDVL